MPVSPLVSTGTDIPMNRLLLAVAVYSTVLTAVPVWGQAGSAPPAVKKPKPGRSLTDRYPLPYPPKLPGGQTVVTERTDAFLTPGPNLREGVEISKVAPTVDFAYYPEQ